jgi:hypothetical protein
MKKILILLLFAVTSVASATTIDFTSPRSRTNVGAYKVINGDYGFTRQKGGLNLKYHPSKNHGLGLKATGSHWQTGKSVFTLCLTEPGKAFDLLGFDSKSWHGYRGEDKNRKVKLTLDGERFDGSTVTWSGNLTDSWSTKTFSQFTDMSLVRFTLDAVKGYTVGYFDNFNVETSSTSAVPVPGAVWLFATGLLGLVAKRRLV